MSNYTEWHVKTRQLLTGKYIYKNNLYIFTNELTNKTFDMIYTECKNPTRRFSFHINLNYFCTFFLCLIACILNERIFIYYNFWKIALFSYCIKTNKKNKENFTSNDDGYTTKNKLIKQVHITNVDIRNKKTVKMKD